MPGQSQGERVIESGQGHSDHTESSAAAADSAAEVLLSFAQVVQAQRLYGPDHPAAANAAANAANHWPTQDARPIRVEITPEGLTMGGDPIAEGSSLRELARHLTNAGFAGMQLSGPGDAPAIADAAAAIASPDDDAPADISDRVRSRTDGAIELVPLDYSVLMVTDSNGTATSPIAHCDLSAALMTRGSQSAVAPAELAARLNERYANMTDAELKALQNQILDASDHNSGDAESTARMQSFLTTLNPSLRKSLLVIDPARPAASLNTLEKIAGACPTDEVLAALEKVDRGSRTTSTASMMLFKRLAEIVVDQPEERSRLACLAGDWAQPAEPGQASRGECVLESLSQLLSSSDEESYNPEEYQQRLEQLTGPIAQQTRFAKDPDLHDDHIIDTRAAEIALEMLAPGFPSNTPADLMRQVVESIDTLLRACPLQVFADAVEAATRWATHDDDPDLAEHCASIQGSFLTEATAQAIAAAVRDQRGNLALAIDLLEQIGEHAAVTALSLLTDKATPANRGRLWLIASAQGDETLANNLAELLRTKPGSLTPLEPLLAALDEDQRMRMLEPAISHVRSSVRREAAAFALELAESTRASLLRRTLSDRDSAVQRVGLKLLAAPASEDEIELLGLFAQGRLDGGLPGQSDFSDAISALIDSNIEAATIWLVCTLELLASSPLPAAANLERFLADRLSHISGRREITKAMHRRSGCWVRRLFGGSKIDCRSAA